MDLISKERDLNVNALDSNANGRLLNVHRAPMQNYLKIHAAGFNLEGMRLNVNVFGFERKRKEF